MATLIWSLRDPFSANVLLVLMLLMLVLSAQAQTNAPVRLALISETDEAATAAEVLTAQFSGNAKVQLLERDEIAKVYREQGLAAGNTDYLKLGRLLGADGLLLLQTVTEGTNQSVNVRLVAVKPGVVLVAERFDWPIKDLTEWSAALAGHLDRFLPKLVVLVKDAIPLSVVNLRSAISAGEAQETERQLKLLTIQRLSGEPQLFVLERQQMGLLGAEKDLQADDSAFWNGSYLFEGVVDQNGYSTEAITINARLSPPKGGAPVTFEVSGSRTNLAAVVNQLAMKVEAALKVHPTVTEWNAADEAAQYLAEAKWALRWGITTEAQAAAESAWALSEHGVEYAMMRISVCLQKLTGEVSRFYTEQSNVTRGTDENGVRQGSTPPDDQDGLAVKLLKSEHPMGRIAKITRYSGGEVIDFVAPDRVPEAGRIDQALQALEWYQTFCQNSPEGEPTVLPRGNGRNNRYNSDWYQLGVRDLEAASRVLLEFHFSPESQPPVAEKLAELRARARAVAGLMAQSPTVRDSYFVGDRVLTHQEPAYIIASLPNLYACEVKWGCLWQEHPEDAVALYRQLMSSPVFSYIHADFWIRESPLPRLAAWNEADRRRLPTVWGDWERELQTSPNPLLSLEAGALTLADATNEAELGGAFTNFFTNLEDRHEALITNNVEVLYSYWGVDRLVEAVTGGPTPSYLQAALRQYYESKFRSELSAWDREYSETTAVGNTPGGRAAKFEKQKSYLTDQTPYDFLHFNDLFQDRNYTKAQAGELLPLLEAYQSNLLAQAAGKSQMEQKRAKRDGQWIQVFAIDRVRDILTPTAPGPQPAAPPTARSSAPPAPPQTNGAGTAGRGSFKPTLAAPEVVTGVLRVDKFLKIPLDGLPGGDISGVTITAHHWFEDRLLLDLQYSTQAAWQDQSAGASGIQFETRQAIALLDPATEHWEVIPCPAVDMTEQNTFYHRTARWQGNVFTSNGKQISQYDSSRGEWRKLAVAETDNYELFVVDHRLYAANAYLIFEILDGGHSTRLLASTRRNPPVTRLDQQSVLGTPALFAGPGSTLRAGVTRQLFTWTGGDWRKESDLPASLFPPEIFPDGVLYVADGFNQPASITGLTPEAAQPVTYLQERRRLTNPSLNAQFRAGTPGMPETFWKLPPGYYLANWVAAPRRSDLYLLAGYSDVQATVNERHLVVRETVLDKDGCNAILLHFSPDRPDPQKAHLDFAAAGGCPPLAGLKPTTRRMTPAMPPAWLLFGGEAVIFASESPLGGRSMPDSHIPIGYNPGVWILPAARLDAAFAGQKPAPPEPSSQSAGPAAESGGQTPGGVPNPPSTTTLRPAPFTP